MRRKLLLGLVLLLWVPLLGIILFSFDHAEPDNQFCAWVVIGLLPLLILILSRWSGKTDLEERAVPVVALAGLAIAAALVYFDLPLWRWIQPEIPLVEDDSLDVEEPELWLGEYEPTPQPVVDKMLSLANVGADDVVFDLGCGDGRIVITAAKRYGAQGVGVDLDPVRVNESRENVEKAGVQDLVEIREGDASQVQDLHRATVVALYIAQEAAIRLRPTLEAALAPGSRIVSHEYDFGEWEPDYMTQLYVDGDRHLIYLWKIDSPTTPATDEAHTP